MKTRFFLVLIVVLSIVLGAVHAQDLNPCFSLSDDDCAAIEEATTNTAAYLETTSSFTVDVDLSFSAADIPGEDGETTSISYSQVGTVDIVKNEDAQTGINAYGNFDITANDGSDDMSMSIEFWLVDDIVYFVNPDDEELYSVDLARVMEESNFSDSMSDPESAMQDLPVDVEAFTPLFALIALPGLLDHVRDGDNFVFTVDLSALTDPDNADAIAAIIASVKESDEEAGTQLESYMSLLPMMLEAGTINFTQSLNNDLGIVDNYLLEANLSVATGMMMGDPQMPSTIVDLSFNVGLGNFDGAENPEAPEGATDITDDVIESLGSFMGMGQQ